MFDLTILSRQARDITEAQFASRENRRGPAPARRVRRGGKASRSA
jgi:hypothetical protein